MRVEFILDCTLDGKDIKAGTKKVLDDNLAHRLIYRGAVKQIKELLKVKKKGKSNG